MIKSIKIVNYQSHKESVLSLSKGINVIIGSSDDGKSAILRSLNWIKDNRPSGMSTVSYWDRGKDNKPQTEQSCEIDVAYDGIDLSSTIIERLREKDFNGYKLNGEAFEAVGTDVPEQISSILNMTEVNLQKQFDSPFLISESAAEIARSFNKVIHLDIIDKVLSNTESMRRKISQDIIKTANTITELGMESQKYNWIESAKEKVVLLRRREERASKKLDNIEGLEKLVQKANEILSTLNKTANIDYEGIIKRIKITRNHAEQAAYKIEIVNSIQLLYQKAKLYTQKMSSLNNEINVLQKSMPQTCPLCGGELKK